VVEQATETRHQEHPGLRGDPPAAPASSRRRKGALNSSHQLVSFLRDSGGFSIGTAGFPEGHIACREGKHVDWQRLKAKVDCGADFVVTQLFFDNADYSNSVITWPGSASGSRLFPACCPSSDRATQALHGPVWRANSRRVAGELETFGDNDAATTEFGIEFATRQCDELIRAGLRHPFYTLNKPHSTTRILKNLALA